MTTQLIILITDLMIFCVLIFHSFFQKTPKGEKSEVKKILSDTFFGKEEKMSEEEKRDREILEMIEKYDGKSIRKEN